MEEVVKALREVTPNAFEKLVALQVLYGWMSVVFLGVVEVVFVVLLIVGKKRRWEIELEMVWALGGVVVVIGVGVLVFVGIPSLLNPEAMAIQSLLP